MLSSILSVKSLNISIVPTVVPKFHLQQNYFQFESFKCLFLDRISVGTWLWSQELNSFLLKKWRNINKQNRCILLVWKIIIPHVSVSVSPYLIFISIWLKESNLRNPPQGRALLIDCSNYIFQHYYLVPSFWP